MNIHDLREAQARFENRLPALQQFRETLHAQRREFINYFNRRKLSNLTLEEYVLGVDPPEINNDNTRTLGITFCYGIERRLDKLGRITGANAYKFGVYYGRTKDDPTIEFRFAWKYGETYTDAFIVVKAAILNLLNYGENEDINAISENILSPMYKGKILATYFPNRYLNIFSDRHLNYFLTQLDLDTEELISSNAVYKREELLRFKNQDEVMQMWTVDAFTQFLYNEYPGHPDREINSVLADYQMPEFPANPIPEVIEFSILPPDFKSHSDKSKATKKKTNYARKARLLKLLGDRGEKIVKDYEIRRLTEDGRVKLASRVKRVSLESDSYGYDILSFERSGAERHIEVKATRSNFRNVSFFLSSNELSTALSDDNYYIYIVFHVTTTSPKIWIVKNPFAPENKNILKTPVNYKISINVSS